MRKSKKWNITKISERLESAEIIEAAERTAQDSLDWISCAQAWIKFADNLKAQKCIERAMAIADFPGAWIECLDVWLLLGDRDKATNCMEEAEKIADDCYYLTFNPEVINFTDIQQVRIPRYHLASPQLNLHLKKNHCGVLAVS